MNRTFLCGKIGKSVKFNPSTWTGLGGDCEAPMLLSKIAELNPNDTFIIIGKNDIDKHRIKLNLPNNLISVYETARKEEKKDPNFIIKKLNNIKIDGCFLLSGPTSNVNIPNKSFKRIELKNGNKIFAKSLETFQIYVAPIYNYLNETNIPWILIANDPRYIKQGNDLLNHPKMILSQYNETIKMKCFDNWENQNYIFNNINSIYAKMEKIFLINQNISELNINDKTIKFLVVLNEGNNGVKSRYGELKKYVLDYIDDVEIYGKWDTKSIKNDERFKGTMDFHELQHTLDKVKYSFMISITEGWPTMKIWELLSHNVIPFMHPGYDTQNNCNMPDFIKIKNPEELHEKIEYLENNQDKYIQILNECKVQITGEDLSGQALSNIIFEYMPAINKFGNDFCININENSSGLVEW